MNAPETRAASPLDALWRAPALIAVLVAGEGLALLLALSPSVVGDRWVYFGLASLGIQWIFLLTLGLLYLLRRPLAKVRAQVLAWLALILLVATTWLVGATGWAVLQQPSSLTGHGQQAMLLRLSGMALILGLFGVVALQNHWRLRQMALRAKQSELEALQARIRPHFLFNTLNTGAALSRAHPEQTERLLLDLADLFRAALGGPREIPLADEIELTRRYLDIEALRFGERLRVEWRLPDDLPDLRVPTLSIQPLVENAIRHGIEPVPAGGRVEIAVETEPDWVRVVVSNDMGDTETTVPGHQVGLSSARERVRALSAGAGDVHTALVDGRHVATIRMPRRESSGLQSGGSQARTS